jgi:hypothetical protein
VQNRAAWPNDTAHSPAYILNQLARAASESFMMLRMSGPNCRSHFMSETTEGSSTPADRRRNLLAFDFEPILEFLCPEGLDGAYQSLNDLTVNSKIAFAILAKSKPELIDASRNMLTGENGAPALILKQRLDEAQTLAELLLLLIEEAKRRTLSSIANCYQADRTLREIVLKIADTKNSSRGWPKPAHITKSNLSA